MNYLFRRGIEWKDGKDVICLCAIAGIFDLTIHEDMLQKALETMSRRGPDGNGISRGDAWALLHSRLAIIDPEGGKQPMELSWNQEEYTIVYNGELYNTEELRLELQGLGHCFCGHSDTEVLLHGFAQWGEAVLEKLNGIFAFAVYLHRKKSLFLARDRIGVKPLFYAQPEKGLIFASEIKTILCHNGVKACLDAQGAAELIMFGPGRIPGSGVLKGIREVEPGCCGWYRSGKFTLKRYWQLRDREHKDSFRETCCHVRDLVTDAIKRQMVSDYPIGTFLSGGLDSSIISAVCAGQMRNRGETLHTFSVDYLNNDLYFTPGKYQPDSDGEYIRVMQNTVGSEHHRAVLRSEDLISTLEDATIARDLPGMADVDFSLLAFCREIRPHVKVALSGECADEIFGGYPWFRDPEIREMEGFPWAQNLDTRMDMLHPDLRNRINGRDLVMDVYRAACDASDVLPGTSQTERRMKEMVNLNFYHFMQTLLDRKDRMSMYCGLEVRVPFCDYRIAEYLYGVPWEFKDYQGREKGLLRFAFQDSLPEQVLWRKKSPYPKTFDPGYEVMVRNRIMAVLDRKNAKIFSVVNRKTVESLLRNEPIWPWYGQLMRVPQTFAWLLQLDYWLDRYQVEMIY